MKEEAKALNHCGVIKLLIKINFTLEFRIDGILRLLIISFFATLPNLIKHFPFINFGEFCQPPRLFRPPLLFETGEYVLH